MSEPVKKQMYVSPAPHFVEGMSTRFLMCMLILALLPETIYGVMLFGFRALLVVLVSVAGSVVFEAAFQKLTKQNITVSDCSAVVTGLLLALVLPPTVPLWQVLLGDLFAIVVAKGFFGGLGANVWNPALTGRAFLFVSFSAAIGAAWLAPGTDAISAATVLSKLKEGAAGNAGAYLESFLGNTAGCIGETNELLILISFAFLALTQVIDWRAPVTMVTTVALLTFVSGGDVVMALTSGGLLFGATFMATDYATTPVSKAGRAVFGAGCGLLTFLIRKFGGYPEGVMFSILFMNSLSNFLNKLTSRKYGYGKAAKKGAAK
ncbi:electron transport complex, rnfabcdge type, D subunit [Treponema socranskii subsp. paredis ATCC 35535]|nr:electron transport complex, rnfabcdge type, D subunit [Treponema socranskii subsp. paredis ATCC 35535]